MWLVTADSRIGTDAGVGWAVGTYHSASEKSRAMRYRVALWGLVGFLIAAGWAVFLWATFPTFHSRELMDVARLTCPISVIGERYHFGVWVGWVLASNAAI